MDLATLLPAIPDNVATQLNRIALGGRAGVLCCVKAKDRNTGEDAYVLGFLIQHPNGGYAVEPVGTISEAPFDQFESPAFPLRS